MERIEAWLVALWTKRPCSPDINTPGLSWELSQPAMSARGAWVDDAPPTSRQVVSLSQYPLAYSKPRQGSLPWPMGGEALARAAEPRHQSPRGRGRPSKGSTCSMPAQREGLASPLATGLGWGPLKMSNNNSTWAGMFVLSDNRNLSRLAMGLGLGAGDRAKAKQAELPGLNRQP